MIPHYVDKDLPILAEIVGDDAFEIIDVEGCWKDVLLRVSACDAVLSSSLHGLIVADAYGIPNAQLILSEKVAGGRFKFNDYALGIEREDLHAYTAQSLSDLKRIALKVETEVPMARNEVVEDRAIRLIKALRAWAIERHGIRPVAPNRPSAVAPCDAEILANDRDPR